MAPTDVAMLLSARAVSEMVTELIELCPRKSTVNAAGPAAAPTCTSTPETICRFMRVMITSAAAKLMLPVCEKLVSSEASEYDATNRTRCLTGGLAQPSVNSVVAGALHDGCKAAVTVSA